MSQRLIDMLNALPRESEYVFPNKSVSSLKATFLKTRKRLAAKLQNPRLLRISFHTLRHWKATMEYHKTKDILHVMKFLRHKKIDNTMIYVQLDQALFGDSEEYICRIAHNIGEAIALIEAGFEYVTGEYDDGGEIFRKRK